MRSTPPFRFVSLMLLLTAAWSAPASAQSANGEVSVLHGAYTAEQAQAGRQQFEQHCAECHIVRQFTGNAFMRAWTGRSVYDLYELIRTTMPNTNPGRLSRQVYADIVAYLLEANELPAGATPLAGDDEALKKVRMPPRAEP